MPTALMVLVMTQMTAIVVVLIFMDNHHFSPRRLSLVRGGNRSPGSAA